MQKKIPPEGFGRDYVSRSEACEALYKEKIKAYFKPDRKSGVGRSKAMDDPCFYLFRPS